MNTRAAFRPLGALLPLLLMAWGCGEPTTPTALDTIDAQFAKPSGGGDIEVESVFPAEGLQGQTLDIEVGGKGFERGDEVALGIDGEPVDAVTTNATTFVGSEVLKANITIAQGASTVGYDVIVTGRKGRKGIGTLLFEVKLGPHQNAIVTDLGSLGGRSNATDINDAGEIVGWDWSDSGRNVLFWDANHEMFDLGPGWAAAINNDGLIVGHYFPTVGEQRAFVWADRGAGQRDDLKPFLELGHTATRAFDVNDAGQVVGWSYVIAGSPTGFIWDGDGGVMTPLSGLPGGSGSSRPFSINLAGHVVGVSGDGSGSTQAVIWLNPDEPISLTDGAEWAYAYGVSDPVDGIVYVAGQRGLSGDYRATLWTVTVIGGAFTVVDLLASSSYAFDVNTSGEVVGDIGQKSRGYLWRVVGGAVETLELGGLTGRGSGRALAINETGLMVGWSQVTTKGKDKGREHAVFWKIP